MLPKDANWNGQKEDPAEYLDYMAKNLVRLQCPQQNSFGYESGKGRKAYVELDDVNVAPQNKSGVNYIHDSALFSGSTLKAFMSSGI